VHPGWVAVALVAALVAAPVGAIAATSVVKIAGSSGNIAQVDPANRLQVAESSPKAFFDSGFVQLDSSAGCQTLVHVPGTKALIVTQINILTESASAFDPSHVLVLAKQAACAGVFVFIDQPHQAGSEVFTLEPGLPLPAGTTISGQSIGTALREIEIRGYFVPKSAVS
jgi:hypothetical protein